MVVTLWRRRNRGLPAMHVEALGRRSFGIFRYGLMSGHLFGDAALGLAIGERGKRREGGT